MSFFGPDKCFRRDCSTSFRVPDFISLHLQFPTSFSKNTVTISNLPSEIFGNWLLILLKGFRGYMGACDDEAAKQ